jgi:hypothetical protein
MISLVWFLQTQAVALENDYVRVTRNEARCTTATVTACRDRVIVALGDLELELNGSRRKMTRGEVAVFAAADSYRAPRGEFLEVTLKVGHPPLTPPAESIPPEKNAVLYDGERFFIFEERLAVGDTRARHSHRQRVVIQLNRTRLQQWPDGEPEVVRDIDPSRVAFNPAVIHTVKNVGDLPLHGIVIELKSPGEVRPFR